MSQVLVVIETVREDAIEVEVAVLEELARHCPELRISLKTVSPQPVKGTFLAEMHSSFEAAASAMQGSSDVSLCVYVAPRTVETTLGGKEFSMPIVPMAFQKPGRRLNITMFPQCPTRYIAEARRVIAEMIIPAAKKLLSAPLNNDDEELIMRVSQAIANGFDTAIKLSEADTTRCN